VADALCAGGAVAFVEAFNAKVGDAAHNAEAARLAARHGLPVTAGSDAHDAAGVGAAWVEMPDFDGPAAFLDALGRGHLVGQLRPHARRYPPPRADPRRGGSAAVQRPPTDPGRHPGAEP
jgi:hypothetical protein